MRWLMSLVAVLAVIAGTVAPSALAADAPIGNIGETLRVDFKGVVADVTVHDVVPTAPPPGYVPTGSPRWRNEGGPWKANVTVRVISAPNPFITSVQWAFNGVTPYADAYQPKNTDAADALSTALQNAPPGATVSGAVYWQVYRALVTNVVLINPQTGTHLAQWNIWQPGTPLP